MIERDATQPAERLPLKMSVEYRRSYARQNNQATLMNISISGAFLETTSAFLSVSDKLEIQLAVGGRQRKVNAEVIWKCDEGCGVRFLPFNNRDVQIVDDLMYFVENNREGRRSVLDDIFKKVA